MIFRAPLERGLLIKRYKRFMADIEREDGSIITAHCPNSGALQGVSDPGTPVWFSTSLNPTRKFPFTWEMAQVNGIFVGTNTSHPNDLVEEAIRLDRIPELKGYPSLRREVPYGTNSRIDILLSEPLVYVEVKNVHWKRDDIAVFPSSVTSRGAKHMRELSRMVEAGHQAYVIYVVQRNDCDSFEIAADVDPLYDQETRAALAVGVKILVYACEVSPLEISLTREMKYCHR